MRLRFGFAILIATVIGLGWWAHPNVELEFTAARVATTLVDFDHQGAARKAIKAGLERHPGSLAIAVSDFTDVPLQFVLIRLSNERPIRLLLGRGGVAPQQETAFCDQLSELFEVRFLEGLGHRFAVVAGHSVVLSSADWTSQALGDEAQSVLEIESEAVVSAYQAQFELLWDAGTASCDDSIDLP
jgi:hypothetical protein